MSPSTNQSAFLRPAFVVGVTGNMDPHESAFGNPTSDIREKIRFLFRFLKRGAQGENGASGRYMEESLPHPRHAEGLSRWTGLQKTLIVVLTSLAPGADSLVAEVALEKEQREMGILVQAPLPFLSDLYGEASTFVKDRSKPTELEKANQKCFKSLIDRIGKENVYPVRLADEVELDDAGLCKPIPN